jgi:hypothetical protein
MLDSPGQDRTGQVRSGQVRSGQVRSGQVSVAQEVRRVRRPLLCRQTDQIPHWRRKQRASHESSTTISRPRASSTTRPSSTRPSRMRKYLVQLLVCPELVLRSEPAELKGTQQALAAIARRVCTRAVHETTRKQQHLQKKHLSPSTSPLCLFRACLGKMFMFQTYENGSKTRALSAPSRAASAA